jgi:hypothetical protein
VLKAAQKGSFPSLHFTQKVFELSEGLLVWAAAEVD